MFAWLVSMAAGGALWGQAQPSVTAVVNAASYATGPVAPGEIVVIFGSAIGPDTLTSLVFSPETGVATTLAGTRVMFDGIAAPLVYASSSQTSAIVPLGVSGKPGVQLEVERLGVRSKATTLPVIAAAPGIFTADTSGKGLVAALNQDLGFHSSSHPARDHEIISLFGTGFGNLTTGAADGRIASGAAPLIVQPSAWIAGAPATVEYAGAAPGQVTGVVQLNIRVPNGIGKGLLPITISAGGAATQDEIRIAAQLGPAAPDNVLMLDNGNIRLGADRQLGGAITVLSSGNGPNLINSFDLGREIQQSYYSGPMPYGKPHPAWPNWPWNPISAGDVYNNRSETPAYFNDGQRIYVQTIPKQWALNNVACECTFETWIQLEDNAAHVHAKLRNRRPDQTLYPARDQELPAVYTNGTHFRLFTYDGSAPFTGAPLREIKNAGPPWAYWQATENWAALVDAADTGVGVFHPGAYRFVGGFAGTPGSGGPGNSPTGYIAPIQVDLLDFNITYDYRYDLILGSLTDIRSYVYAHRPDTRPEYVFASDRQHWRMVNASDGGFPMKGAWHVNTDQVDPYLIGPGALWNADDVPKLYVRAAHHTKLKSAQIFWSIPGEGFSPARVATFPVLTDGAFHTYEVDLSNVAGYSGQITGIRFDPVDQGTSGEYVEIQYVSYRKLE